jgi:hypothetical protein
MSQGDGSCQNDLAEQEIRFHAQHCSAQLGRKRTIYGKLFPVCRLTAPYSLPLAAPPATVTASPLLPPPATFGRNHNLARTQGYGLFDNGRSGRVMDQPLCPIDVVKVIVRARSVNCSS